MASTLPPAAEKANANTLSEALAATSLSATPSPSSEPKELNGNDKENKDVKADDELEDGEIREDEEDDGRVKTVFDDADKFNVKVGLRVVKPPECPDHVQHPLYSKWTLYFDSPNTKNLPKTPSSTPAAPQIAHGELKRRMCQMSADEDRWMDGRYSTSGLLRFG